MIIPEVSKMWIPRPGADSAPDALYRMEEERSARRNEPPAAATVNTMLEQKGIKVTLSQEQEIEGHFYKGIAIHCKSWMCPVCSISKGYNLRKQLLKKVHLFKVFRLFTVTVNRAYFESPEAAYEYVMKNKFIARLLTKEMGVKRWFWVLEAQEENGDGWPHWHILIDVGDLPGMWHNKATKNFQPIRPADKTGWSYIPHYFDLNRAHYLLTKWHIGEQCELSIKHDNFQSREHAINYVTEYMVKPNRRGFPEWMLKHKGLRFYQPSKAIGSIAEDKKHAAPKQAKDIEEKQRRNRQPVERIAECRKKVLFMSYNPQQDKHTITKPFMALKESIALAPGAVCVQDFDFLTLRSFPVWGFNTIEDVLNFQEIWSDARLQEKMESAIKEKKNELLQKWASCA